MKNVDLTSDGNSDHNIVTESKNEIDIILFAKHRDLNYCVAISCLPEKQTCSVIKLSTYW